MTARKITSKDFPKAAEYGERHPVSVVLDNIRSTFNVGSAFRTGDAAGIEKLYLCGISAYPVNSKIDKTALGSTEVVPWQYYKTTAAALHELKQRKIPVCIVELTTESVGLWEYQFPKPAALVFGHELYGVSDEILDLADAFIYIPMYGKKTTVNVSTALGIVLFEVLRQWNTPLVKRWVPAADSGW
jgi:tRNA G18 (ribose-2'-O)-methylase SpoU